MQHLQDTHHDEDMVDAGANELEHQSRRATGASALHWATLISIGASITLFLAGKRELAIFVGLWPPTFQALKANAEHRHTHSHSHSHL